MADVEIKVRANGPYVVKGPFVLRDGEGNESDPARRNDTIVLCRCGASQNKPFCDGSHATVGFNDPGTIPVTT